MCRQTRGVQASPARFFLPNGTGSGASRDVNPAPDSAGAPVPHSHGLAKRVSKAREMILGDGPFRAPKRAIAIAPPGSAGARPGPAVLLTPSRARPDSPPSSSRSPLRSTRPRRGQRTRVNLSRSPPAQPAPGEASGPGQLQPQPPAQPASREGQRARSIPVEVSVSAVAAAGPLPDHPAVSRPALPRQLTRNLSRHRCSRSRIWCRTSATSSPR